MKCPVVIEYKMQKRPLAYFIGVFFIIVYCPFIYAHSVVEQVARLKPSVVGVGLYDALAAQKHQLRGTGFAFGDGSLIATNHHVLAAQLDPVVVQYHIVMVGTGAHPQVYRARVLAQDLTYDIAILKIDTQLKPVKLADDTMRADGTEVLITGFPIGAVLGLYPATHKGIIAASTPDIIPTINSNQLTTERLVKLKNPYLVYQLDITAYPGNSGSPLYSAENGEVVGILNKVFVQDSKESLLEKPSGISYAIPVKYLRELAQRHNLIQR